MIRIVHLSDIHLNQSSMKDIDNYIIPSLCTDLKSRNNDIPIDLILLTGDLVDRGGYSFGDLTAAFITFEEKVIEPIIDSIGISKSNIILSPGNHDINRKADSEIEEKGIKSILVDPIALNEFLDDKNGNKQGIKRIQEYSEFIKSFYDFNTGSDKKYYLSNFESCFKYSFSNFSVGVASLNSSWRCFDSEKDKGSLLLGERQVFRAYDFLKDCDLRLALMHHPYEYYEDFDRSIITKMMQKYFQIVFCGHVHQGSNWGVSNMYGNQFVSVAPSNWSYNLRSKDRSTSIGYYVVDIDPMKSRINNWARRYSFDKNQFDPNLDLGDENGLFTHEMKNLLCFNEIHTAINLSEKIQDLHYEDINSHLLSYNSNTSAPKKLEEIFVQPCITDSKNSKPNESGNEKEYSIHDLCESSGNYLIWGCKESGKTVLLDKIMLELSSKVTTYGKIPVLFDFSKTHFNKFETVIYRFLSIGMSELKTLLKNSRFCVLIDNIKIESKSLKKLDILSRFLIENPNIQVIATASTLTEGRIPIEKLLEFQIFSKFRLLEINNFKAKQIRSLIKIWFSNSHTIDTSEKVEQLLQILINLNLPRTPLAISMFLWIIEQQENYRPVNHATMLENFIERLFKKHSNIEVYSESFDYRNKERLLTELAFKMYELNNENYHMDYSKLMIFLSEYFENKKFDYKVNDVLSDFIEAGILIEERLGGVRNVRFRFTCFFSYFLMKKIDFDIEFKKFVLREDNYLNFFDELDYFTGIKRDQSSLLKLLIGRMLSEYDELIQVINKLDNSFDTFFTFDKNFKPPFNGNFIEKLEKIPKPDEDELDNIQDELLSSIPAEKGIKKKEVKMSPFSRMEKLWTLCAHVIKNTEETDEEGLKSQSYQAVLKCAMAFACVHKTLLQDYLENKKQINLNYKQLLEFQLNATPLLYEIGLHYLLGTSKLSVVIREKIELDRNDQNISEFEKFLSVFLYADIRGKDYLEIIKKYVRTLKSKYFSDISIFKLFEYYLLRSKTEEMDLFYKNLMADVVIKNKGISKQNKAIIMNDYEKKKKQKNPDIE